MTSYETVGQKALRLLTDFDFAQFTEEVQMDTIEGYINNAIERLPAKVRKALPETNDANQCFMGDLTRRQILYLALGCLREWLSPQIFSVTNTLQVFGDKESKFYSQKEHLVGLIALDDKVALEIKKMARDDTFDDNSYFS